MRIDPRQQQRGPDLRGRGRPAGQVRVVTVHPWGSSSAYARARPSQGSERVVAAIVASLICLITGIAFYNLHLIVSLLAR